MLVCLARESCFRLRRISGARRTDTATWAVRSTTTFEKSNRSSAVRMISLTDFARPSRTGSLRRSRNSTSSWMGKGRGLLCGISEAHDFPRRYRGALCCQLIGRKDGEREAEFQRSTCNREASFVARAVVAHVNRLHQVLVTHLLEVEQRNRL